MQHGMFIHAVVMNRGSGTARDVKIAQSGTGMAQILSRLGRAEAQFFWTNSVPLGDIVPDSQTEVLIWPDGLSWALLTPPGTVTVVHSSGVDRLYTVREFWGRVAEWSFQYDQKGTVSKIFDSMLALFLVAIAGRLASPLRRAFSRRRAKD